MHGSRRFRSKLPAISRPSSSPFHYQDLWWRNLAVQVGTTKDQDLYNKPQAAVHPGGLAAGNLQHNITYKLNRFILSTNPLTLTYLSPLQKQNILITFSLSLHNSPQQAKASPLSRVHDYAQTHYNRQESSRLVISPTQRLLPGNTQHSQLTDIPAGFEPTIPAQASGRRPTRQTARPLRPALVTIQYN